MATGIFKSNSTINQPTDWFERVAAFCEKLGISRNELIFQAVNRYMESYREKTGEAA